MTIIWCMVPDIWSMIDWIFCHLGHFSPFYPTNNPESQHFGKMRKSPGDIPILDKYTKNYDCMTSCSWDMVHDRCNFYFYFRASFWPLTLGTAQRSEFFKNDKNAKRYHHFLQVCHKSCHMMYGSWDAVHNRWTDGQTEKVT